MVIHFFIKTPAFVLILIHFYCFTRKLSLFKDALLFFLSFIYGDNNFNMLVVKVL